MSVSKLSLTTIQALGGKARSWEVISDRFEKGTKSRDGGRE